MSAIATRYRRRRRKGGASPVRGARLVRAGRRVRCSGATPRRHAYCAVRRSPPAAVAVASRSAPKPCCSSARADSSAAGNLAAGDYGRPFMHAAARYVSLHWLPAACGILGFSSSVLTEGRSPFRPAPAWQAGAASSWTGASQHSCRGFVLYCASRLPKTAGVRSRPSGSRQHFRYDRAPDQLAEACPCPLSDQHWIVFHQRLLA